MGKKMEAACYHISNLLYVWKSSSVWPFTMGRRHADDDISTADTVSTRKVLVEFDFVAKFD